MITLKEYRKKHGLSLFAFAVKAGVTEKTVWNVEKGLHKLHNATKQKIIAATNGEVTEEMLDKGGQGNGMVEDSKTR